MLGSQEQVPSSPKPEGYKGYKKTMSRRGFLRRTILASVGGGAAAILGPGAAPAVAKAIQDDALLTQAESRPEREKSQDQGELDQGELIVEKGVLLDPKPGYSPWALWNLITGGLTPPASWTDEPMQAGVPWKLPTDLTGGDRKSVATRLTIIGNGGDVLTDPDSKKLQRYIPATQTAIDALVAEQEFIAGSNFVRMDFLCFREGGKVRWYACPDTFNGQYTPGKLKEAFAERDRMELEADLSSTGELLVDTNLAQGDGVAIQPAGIRIYGLDKNGQANIEYVSSEESALVKAGKGYLHGGWHEDSPYFPTSQGLFLGNGKAILFSHKTSAGIRGIEEDRLRVHLNVEGVRVAIRVSEDVVMKYLNKQYSDPLGIELKRGQKASVKALLGEKYNTPGISNAQTPDQLYGALDATSLRNLKYLLASLRI